MWEPKIEDLPRYVNMKDYAKIMQILKNNQKVRKPNLVEILETQLEIIRVILRNDIRFLLYNRKIIDPTKIQLTEMLGEDFFDEIGDIVRENLVERFFNRFKKDLYATHKKGVLVENFKSAMAIFNENFDKVIFATSKFSEKWNIKGEFVFRVCLLMKETLSKDLEQRKKEKSLIKTLEQVVAFEKKYTQNFFIKDCCKVRKPRQKKAIIFDNSEVNIQVWKNIKTNIVLYDSQASMERSCKHKKMLSRLFVPYSEIYLRKLFEKPAIVNQSSVELNIISAFISYFKKLREILPKVRYFDEPTVFNVFVNLASRNLSKMMSSLHSSNDVKNILTILNTLNFVEQTFKDLLVSIIDHCTVSFESLCCFKEKRVQEKFYNLKFEKLVRSDLFSHGFSKKFSREIIAVLNNRLIPYGLADFGDEIRLYVLECIFSCLFCFISKHKLTPKVATDFLVEIADINYFLQKKYTTPMLVLIERYLKIFLCDPSEVERFVDNYLLHSESMFSFSQILSMLKNQQYNSQLFVLYKKKINIPQALGSVYSI